ncbi:MAG: NAD(P)/FAD-dependent oxidoreductase, partial [Actinomycetes bacterium]
SIPALRALISASGPRFAALSAELGGPPLLSPRPVLWAAFDDVGECTLRAHLAELTGEPDAAVELTAAEAVARCPVLRPNGLRCAAITEAACDIDAMALHQAYVRGLRARNGTVLTSAPVTGLTATSTGWQVRYGDEQVLDTTEVVNAAGAWVDVVASLARVRQIGLRPFRRTIVVARVPDPSRLRSPGATALPMVIEATERCYFKAEGVHLLLSPGDETPVDPSDVRPDPADVARALERVEELTMLGLRSVQSAWAGLRSFVADRNPVIGNRPEHAGFHFFAGQGGSGIEAAPALAAIGASMIIGHPTPPDVAVDPAALTPLRLDVP